MKIEKFNDPLFIEWHKDSNGNKTSIRFANEQYKIVKNQITLKQIPDYFNKVKILNMLEVEDRITSAQHYKVDYNTGVVTFHQSLDNQTITVGEYYGRGVIMYPASRIYTEISEHGVVKTIGDLIQAGQESIEAVGDMRVVIERAEQFEQSIDNSINTAMQLNSNLQSNIDTGNAINQSLNDSVNVGGNTNSILSETINNANNIIESLDSSFDNANSLKNELDSIVTTGTMLKSDLDSNINNGGVLNNQLQQSIDIATVSKEDLESTIINADSIKNELNNGVIEANSINSTLVGNIDEANELTQQMSSLITNVSDSEEQRIQNEIQRVEVELYRISNEADRIANELERASNEQIRTQLQTELMSLKIQLETLRDSLIDSNFGDMFKSVYDTNNNGKVDMAENSERFGGQLPSHYATKEYVDSLGTMVEHGNEYHNEEYVTKQYVDAKESMVQGLETNLNSIVQRVDNMSNTLVTHLAEFEQYKQPLYQTIKSNSNIGSFPSSAEGQVSDLRIQGNTYTQIIKNGNFANELTSWVKRGNHSGSSITNGQLNIIATGNGDTGGIGDIYQDVKTTTIGDVFYYSFRVKNNGGDLCNINFMAKTSSPTRIFTITNDWQRVSGIVTSNYSGQYLHLYCSNITSGANLLVDDVILINLTKEGLTNISVNDCDTRFSTYVDGTKSTISAGRLKSVGKNLFLPSYKDFSKYDIRETYYWQQIQLIPNTTYTIHPNASENMNGKKLYWLIASEKKAIGFTIGDWLVHSVDGCGGLKSITFTTNSIGIMYFGFYCDNGVTKINFDSLMALLKPQLEQNTVATPYEPYTESTSYLPNVGELRSLPNGTKDEISEGRKIQRVSDTYTFKNSDVEFIYTGTNTQIIGMKLNSTIFSNISQYYNEFIRINNYPYKYTVWDDVANIGYAIVEGDRIRFVFTKGTFADLTSAQNWISTNAITLNYQLANEIVTQLPLATLRAYPNGTWYIDPGITDVGIYKTDGISILNVTLPIKEMHYVNKIDVQTGKLTPIDLAKVTINVNKLGFTITGAVAGEYYDYGYGYPDELSTIPSSKWVIASNHKAQTNSNTNAIQRLDLQTNKQQNEIKVLSNIRVDDTKPFRVEVKSSAPSSALDGQMYYDSTEKKFKGRANGAWV